MARRSSQSEQKMHAVQAKADAELYRTYEDIQEILHSWGGGELVLDVHHMSGDWQRFVWVPADDTEIQGVRELA